MPRVSPPIATPVRHVACPLCSRLGERGTRNCRSNWSNWRRATLRIGSASCFASRLHDCRKWRRPTQFVVGGGLVL
eukprot:1434282-Prorocentrum_lima.AAC.1